MLSVRYAASISIHTHKDECIVIVLFERRNASKCAHKTKQKSLYFKNQTKKKKTFLFFFVSDSCFMQNFQDEMKKITKQISDRKYLHIYSL